MKHYKYNVNYMALIIAIDFITMTASIFLALLSTSPLFSITMGQILAPIAIAIGIHLGIFIVGFVCWILSSD